MYLLPQTVDRVAAKNPAGLYAEYPVSPHTYDHGFRKITYHDFANAIKGLAFWLSKTLGPGDGRQVLAYIGPNDLRYSALILAAVKAGYVIFLTSPRNSISAQKQLFESLKCKLLLCSSPQPAPIGPIAKAHPAKILEVPDLDDLLNETHPHFEFTKTFEEHRDEPLFIAHTSGSTGVPKAMIFTHEAAARNIKLMSLEAPVECVTQERA